MKLAYISFLALLGFRLASPFVPTPYTPSRGQFRFHQGGHLQNEKSGIPTRFSTDCKSKTVLPLNTGWQFQKAGENAWHPATVPGCVHTDLLNNKLIDDPFYRDNEQQLQWIGKTFWTYQTTFLIRPAILDYENIELVFQGP